MEAKSTDSGNKYQKFTESAPQNSEPLKQTEARSSPLKRDAAGSREQSEFLTIPDLMAVPQVCRDTVYRILGWGEMAFVRTDPRSSIRIRPEALEEWRREQETTNKENGGTPTKDPRHYEQPPTKESGFDYTHG